MLLLLLLNSFVLIFLTGTVLCNDNPQGNFYPSSTSTFFASHNSVPYSFFFVNKRSTHSQYSKKFILSKPMSTNSINLGSDRSGRSGSLWYSQFFDFLSSKPSYTFRSSNPTYLTQVVNSFQLNSQSTFRSSNPTHLTQAVNSVLSDSITFHFLFSSSSSSSIPSPSFSSFRSKESIEFIFSEKKITSGGDSYSMGSYYSNYFVMGSYYSDYFDSQDHLKSQILLTNVGSRSLHSGGSNIKYLTQILSGQQKASVSTESAEHLFSFSSKSGSKLSGFSFL